MYVNVNSDFYEYQSAAGGVAVGMFVLAILFWIFYFLKKDMNLSIQNGGDLDYGLVFKRSVIENVTVDIKKVKQASLLVNAAVLQAATMEKV